MRIKSKESFYTDFSPIQFSKTLVLHKIKRIEKEKSHYFLKHLASEQFDKLFLFDFPYCSILWLEKFQNTKTTFENLPTNLSAKKKYSIFVYHRVTFKFSEKKGSEKKKIGIQTKTVPLHTTRIAKELGMHFASTKTVEFSTEREGFHQNYRPLKLILL